MHSNNNSISGGSYDRPTSYLSDATAVGGQQSNTGGQAVAADRMGSLSSLKGVNGNGSGNGMMGQEAREDVVPVAFDEGVLRGLCDMDVSCSALSRAKMALTLPKCALPLLADRIKQCIASCKVSVLDG